MLHFGRFVCFASLLATAAACGDNQTESVPPVEDTPQAGGAVGPMASAGSRLFVAVGPRVQIWNVVDPLQPRLLGTTAAVPATVIAVAVSGRHLFIGEDIDLDGRVHVFDIDDPVEPRHITTFRTVPGDAPSEPRAFAVDDEGMLYVADREQGVLKFDITDVRAPLQVASFTFGGVTDLRLTDDRVFASGTNFFAGVTRILDRELRELGSVPGNELTAAAPASSNLLATSGTVAAQIFDIADPTAPIMRFEDEQLRGFAVEAAGTTAWYPTDYGVVTIDLADPDAPSFHVTVDEQLAGARRSLTAAGLLAFGTDRGRLALLDVSAPNTPSFLSAQQVTPCTDCIAAAHVGEHLIVADSASGLRSVRQRDLAAVGTTRRESFVVYEDVAIAGQYAYVADWNFGLRVFDVADPARVIEVSNLFTNGLPAAISIDGERAVLGMSTDGGAIHVIDIRDPEAPRALGNAPTTKTRDVLLAGNLVYAGDEGVAGAPGGMRIFDVTKPKEIKLLSHFVGCDHVISLAVDGSTAALACDQQGLVLLDVANPRAPVTLGALDLAFETDAARAVAIDGDRVYLGTVRGVDVIDISNPTKPRRAMTLPTAWQVRGITVPEPGHVLAAAGLGGLYQWRLQ